MLSLVERGNCPICNGEKGEDVFLFDRIPVRRCLFCQFLYSGKVMADDSSRSYYRDDFGSLRHRRGQMVNARVNVAMLRRLLDLGRVKSVLDIGTGYGFLLRELKHRFAIRVTGVELSEQESTYGRSMMQLDIRNSPLNEAGLPKGSYDLVTSFEVIEHVKDPISFVQGMAEYMAPNGHVVIMTDNFECRVAKRLGASFPKWIPHSHISHLAPETLSRVLNDAGLRIVRWLSYDPWELVAKSYIHTLRGRRCGVSDFDLADALASEMSGKYRLFHLRLALNVLWASIASRANPQGALMYAVATHRSQ